MQRVVPCQSSQSIAVLSDQAFLQNTCYKRQQKARKLCELERQNQILGDLVAGMYILSIMHYVYTIHNALYVGGSISKFSNRCQDATYIVLIVCSICAINGGMCTV